MRSHLLLALLLLLSLSTAGCRSPFGKAAPEKGPDAGKVGRGIHGWPLLESAPHGEGWRTDVIWPGYSQVRTAGDGLNSTDVLWPIFHHATEGSRTRSGILRPLFDLETKGDEVYDLDLLWPVFKWRDSPKSWERRVFPVYWEGGKGEDRGHLHLWPLWGEERRGSWERTWYGSLAYVRTTDPEADLDETDLLLSTIHWGRDGDETDFHLFPLIWHNTGPQTYNTVVFPIIWGLRDGNETFDMLFPMYGEYRNGKRDRIITVGGPLYIGGNEGDETFSWVLAPIFHWRDSPDEWGGHVFPVFWYERDKEGDGHTTLWPVFGWETHGERTTASVATPFLAYEWDDDSWNLDLPWPFVNFQGDANGGSSYVFPLYHHESREKTAEGAALLFVATWESNEEKDESDFRVLWRLIESSRQDGKDTFVVNPLFRHESNDDGDTYWSFLFGLVARKQEAGKTDWRFLWVL